MAATTKAVLAAQVRRLRKSLDLAKAKNAALGKSLAEADEQLTATAGILKTIADSPADVQPVLDAVAERAARLTDSPNVTLLLREGDVLRAAANFSRDANLVPDREHRVPIRKTFVTGRAILKRKTVHVEDVVPLLKTEYPGARDNQRRFGFRSVLAVPMIRKDNAVGVLYAWRREVRKFTPAQIALLKTFADQAVIAIENVRLFNETKEALERQTATAEILKVISSSPNDLSPVFDAILDRATRLCEAQLGFVFTCDGQAFDLVAQRGLDDEQLPAVTSVLRANRVPGPRTGLGQILSKRRIVHVPDAMDTNAYRTRDPLRVSTVDVIGARTLLAVPLLKDDAVIGAVVIYRREVRPFSDKQLALLQTFADQAAIAIENVRLFNETKEALDQLKASSEVLQVISSSVADTKPVFAKILESSERIFEGRNVGICLVGDDGAIHLSAYHGPNREELMRYFPVPLSEASGNGMAILRRRVIHYPDTDAADVPDYVRGGGRIGGNRSALFAPMLLEGRGIGSIFVGRPTTGAFSEKEIGLLKTFADQAVIAIENVRLFNETKEALERQTATSEILRAISGSLTEIAPVFDAILESAIRLCEGDTAVLWQYDGQVLRLATGKNTSKEGAAYLHEHPLELGTYNPTPQAGLERRAIHVLDVFADPGYRPLVPVGRTPLPNAPTVLAVPLLRESELLGVITIWRFEKRLFTEKQVEMVDTFAAQAVIAIENVRLFNETKEALERQTATAEILKVISSSPTDVKPVFGAIAERAAALCAAQFGFVARYDGDLIHHGASVGPSPEALELHRAGYPIKPGSGSVTARVVLQGVPVQIEDMFADPAYAQKTAAERGGFRSGMGVPMVREGKVIGAIVVVRTEPGRFSEKQVGLLQTFADQAVIAIENVRLFNETREALEQQTAISEILRVMSGSPSDVTPVLEAVSESAMRICESTDARIYLVEGDKLRYAAGRGDVATGEIGLTRPIDRGLVLGRAVIDKVPVHIEDLAAVSEAEYPIARQVQREFGHRTTLAVPLLRESRALGAILLRRIEVRPFTEKQISLLKTFANQAAIAIENVRLFNETKEALERQTATSELLKVIGRSTFDLQPVFDTLAENAVRLCEARQAFIFRFDGQLLRVVASCNTSAELRSFLERNPIAPGRGTVAGRAALEGRTLHVHDVRTDPEYSWAAHQVDPIRTVLTIPMVRAGEVLGVIGVNRHEVLPFTDKQVDLLQTFADQAAIAIENVRLFNETKEALERQTATAEILKVISGSPTDVRPVFEAIARSAVAICSSTGANVFRYDGERLDFAAGHNTTGELAEMMAQKYPMRPDRSQVAGRVILSRSVIRMEDALSDPDYDERFAIAGGWRRVLGVPMLREGSPIGAIVVRWTEPGPIPMAQEELLKTFADQAVIAIENVRLFNELDARNRALTEALEQQTATSEILRVISQSPTDVQPVFDIIAERAVSLCNGEVSVVSRFDGTLLQLAAIHGVAREGVEALRAVFPMRLDAETLTSRAFRQRALIHMKDVFADPQYERKQTAIAAGWRGGLAVPMVRGTEVIGVIFVGRSAARLFTESQVELLKTFADQAVIAVENVRLFNETKEALERQTATAEILRVISSSPTDIQPVFDTVAQNASRLCEAPDVVIVMAEGQSLRFAASAGPFGRTFEPGFAIPIDRGSVAGRALLDRRTIHIDDLAAVSEDEYPVGRALQRRHGHRTMVAVPLLRGDTALGDIVVLRKEVRPFSDRQVALLKTFADQAVIAIENVRLFNETKEALERQTATAEILSVISSSPTDVQPVFDAIARSALRLIGGRSASVARRVEDMLHLAAHTATTDSGDEALRKMFPTPLTGQGVTGKAVLTGMPAYVVDIETDPAYSPSFREGARARGYRSMLAVPMIREGAAVGGIVVTRRDPGRFTDHQINLLKTFADQAVIAIENVRLFNETKEALERQTATAEILKVISSSPRDLQPVFDAILEKAMHLCEAHLGFLGLFDGARYEHVAQRGTSPEYAKWITRGPFVPDPGMSVARAIRERKPVHYHDLRESPGYREGIEGIVKTVEVAGARTLLAVPMLKEERAVGGIVIYRPEVRPFTQKQIDLLSTFASQAVIAIENVRLFKELEARTEALARSVGQLTALGEVGQAISSTLDLETVLQTIVSRAVQLSGLDGGTIYEYDERAEEYHLRASENLSAEIVEAIRRAPIRRNEGPVWRAGVTGQPTEIPEMLDESYQTPRREFLIREGYRALLVVPLVREDHIIGALSVVRKSPGAFAPEVVELLKTFATQSALAIQNARLFREIAEKGRQLEVASRHKSDFLASMSHELRTPLNALLGFNEMILGDIYGAVPADMQPPLAQMQVSGKHLLRLINNVLDLAKIEAGRMELALADYSVQDAVESVRSTLRPLAADKGLEFLATVPADIPLAHGDPGRITQCLMNLAGNSLKFTKTGQVEISVAEKGGVLTYRVADTGIGIPPDKIGSLFTEFKQTDATIASEYGGTGLGLSISKKFVEMHGGRIWVESEPGSGSTFIFEIPLRAGEGKAA